MATYTNKTQPTELSPADFIKTTANTSQLADCLALLDIFTKVTGYKPVIWGKVIGYGKYHYKQKATEGDWYITGFAPRASEITIYCIGGYQQMTDLLDKLGKHKVKGSCLHIKKLTDIDVKVLEQIVLTGVEFVKANYKVAQ